MHGCIQVALRSDPPVLRSGSLSSLQTLQNPVLSPKVGLEWEVLVCRLETNSLSVQQHLPSSFSGPETGEVTLQVAVVKVVVVNGTLWGGCHHNKATTTFDLDGPAQATSHGVTPFGKESKDSRGVTGSERSDSFWLVLRFAFLPSCRSHDATAAGKKKEKKKGSHRQVRTTRIQF